MKILDITISHNAGVTLIEDGYIVASILEEYKKQTGYSILVNTSFNMHEEPIVCSPQDVSDLSKGEIWTPSFSTLF